MNILVGYASVHGSTAETAQFIGGILRERGLRVDVADVAQVQTAAAYDGFVLGSAIHTGRMLPAMTAFMQRCAPDLTRRPVYLWVMCLCALEDGGDQHVLAEYVPPEALAGVSPVEVRAFPGRLDLSALALNERWLLCLRYDGTLKPERHNHDYRSWDAMGAWAMRVAAQLRQGTAPARARTG